MFVDSHTHLYLEDFKGEETAVVQRAIERGVKRLMFPNVDLTTLEPMKQLASVYPDNVDMAIGLHPTEVKDDWAEILEVIESEAASGKYLAIGEIGVDLYWDKTYREQQIKAFYQQCLLAQKYNLPVIIHCREALDEVLDVLKKLPEPLPQMVFHSFGGTVEDVKRIRQIGDFYFGINGIVTFKNSKLSNVLPEIGLDRILLETDSPYLSPVPMRGRRNESSNIIHIANHVSHILNVPLEKVENITTENYLTFLGVNK